MLLVRKKHQNFFYDSEVKLFDIVRYTKTKFLIFQIFERNFSIRHSVKIKKIKTEQQRHHRQRPPKS